MDLLDFTGHDDQSLYFEETLAPEVEALLQQGAEQYAEGTTEAPLLHAHALAPESLTVLVALYRYYFYRHRIEDALRVADQAVAITARRLDWPTSWQTLTPEHLSGRPLPLVRFHLMALKGAAYLLLRLGRQEEAEAMLDTLIALDPEDRLGATVLKGVIAQK